MAEQNKSKYDEYNNLQDDADKIAGRGVVLELFVLHLLAKRLRQIGTGVILTLEQREKDLQEIAKQLHLNEVLIKADTNRLLERLLRNMYKDAEYLYAYTGAEYVPFEDNEQLMALLNEVKTEVLEDTRFRTQAFMLRNPQNRKELIPTPLSEAYNEVINEAAEQVANGVGDYESAIRETTKDLIDSGLETVDYDTESGKGYHQNTEAAVRRNVLDNVRDINQKGQDAIGEQYGSDGKEITVHEFSAPDHEPIQGHQFTNEEYEKLQNSEEFEDYKGRKFSAIKRHIGQYNCRHFTYSILLGISIPNFTDEELQENIKRNHDGYTNENGTHRTMYECTQEQRRLEREIRKAKTGVMIALESGDIELARQYQERVDELVQKYKDFSEACGLEVKGERLYVEGYRRVKI